MSSQLFEWLITASERDGRKRYRESQKKVSMVREMSKRETREMIEISKVREMREMSGMSERGKRGKYWV